MKQIVSSIFLFTLLASHIPIAGAASTLQSRSYSRREQRILFRVCESVDSDDRARCQARQIGRSQNTWRQGKPEAAFELYDRLDRGQSHLRRQLQRERAVKLRRHWSQNRSTFAELGDAKPKEKTGTQNSTVVELRKRQLACMLEPHGRPRRICFDQLNHDGVQRARRNSGSRQYPAR